MDSVGDLYRTESKRLLAVLVRIFGVANMDLAEDVLQDAFIKATSHWEEYGIPDNPSGWIMRVAKNAAIDVIRANRRKKEFAPDLTKFLESEWSMGGTVAAEFQESNIRDDELRMIFMCCGADIKPENRIPFVLRTLCGLSIPAIGRALLIPEATVKKRLLRTKEKLSQHDFSIPPPEEMAQAMDSVHTVLYLLFNEGAHSSDGKRPIRRELCQDAMGLVGLLADEPRVYNRDTAGLSALMHYHFGRLDARIGSDGELIPIDQQDRSRWQPELFRTADQILDSAQSLPPGASGRFVVEAQIAREHCRTLDFAETDWRRIRDLYAMLAALTGSPVAALHWAIAAGYAGDVPGAVAAVERTRQHRALKNSHMPDAILAHLYAMAGDESRARHFANAAAAKGGTPHEHRLMMQQVERLLSAAANPSA